MGPPGRSVPRLFVTLGEFAGAGPLLFLSPDSTLYSTRCLPRCLGSYFGVYILLFIHKKLQRGQCHYSLTAAHHALLCLINLIQQKERVSRVSR